MTAVPGLLALKDPRAVDPLIGMLEDPDTEVRLSVILAVGSLADSRVGVAIVPYLSAEDYRVWWTAEIALEGLSDKSMIEPLIPTLRENPDRVRFMCARVLGKITGIQDRTDPKWWLTWWDERERMVDP